MKEVRGAKLLTRGRPELGVTDSTPESPPSPPPTFVNISKRYLCNFTTAERGRWQGEPWILRKPVQSDSRADTRTFQQSLKPKEFPFALKGSWRRRIWSRARYCGTQKKKSQFINENSPRRSASALQNIPSQRDEFDSRHKKTKIPIPAGDKFMLSPHFCEMKPNFKSKILQTGRRSQQRAHSKIPVSIVSCNCVSALKILSAARFASGKIIVKSRRVATQAALCARRRRLCAAALLDFAHNATLSILWQVTFSQTETNTEINAAAADERSGTDSNKAIKEPYKNTQSAVAIQLECWSSCSSYTTRHYYI